MYPRLLHPALNSTAAQNYWGLLEYQARVTIVGIAGSPEDFFHHLERYSLFLSAADGLQYD
jgi:hypothetical protein